VRFVNVCLTKEEAETLERIAAIEGATLEDEIVAAAKDRVKWARKALARVDLFHEEHPSYGSCA
jgi:hypothetical protein